MVKRDVRSGAKWRRQATAIDKKRHGGFSCPQCGKKNVKRVSFAVWQCNSCGTKVAGGAYQLSTEPGKISQKTIKGEQ